MDRPQRTPTNAASTSNQFQCPNCPDSFPSPYGLGQHAKLHGSDRKYKCTGCNYACDNARTLKSHRRICLKNRAAPAVNNDTPCARVDGPTTKATVQGLKEGEEYAKAGPSKASDPSRKLTAKARQAPLGVKDVLKDLGTSGTPAPDQPLSSTTRRREPRRPIDMAAVEDLGTSGTSARIVETPGELVILKCVVEGNPAPKFAWKKGGREVPLTDDRLRCQTDGDTRTRKAKAPLNVPGPPGPPKPLNTAYNSITLQWAQPLRDGGTPITGYELEKRECGTNAQWENAAFGSVPDTQFKVTGVKQYHFYEFRVAAVNAVGQGEWSDNSVPIAATRSSCKPLITMGMLARENDLGSDSVDLRLEVVDRPAPPEGSETAGACPTIVIKSAEKFQKEK